MISLFVDLCYVECVCVCVYKEMIDFDKSDTMLKISGKVDKPTLKKESVMIFRSLFKKTSSEWNFFFQKNPFSF